MIRSLPLDQRIGRVLRAIAYRKDKRNDDLVIRCLNCRQKETDPNRFGNFEKLHKECQTWIQPLRRF